MSADAIKQIKSLRSEAAKLDGFHAHFAEKYAADRNCDKKGYGFNYDDRFAAFSVTAKFSSHAGYYGSSSCSTVLSIYDRKVVEAAFVKALNIHQKELFATAARLMREEAAALTVKAEAEIQAMQEMIAEAKAEAA
jgi:hypothetical protein